MKRVISLWLPNFATDRLRRQQTAQPRTPRPENGPLATVTAIHGGQRIAAVNGAARAQGIGPGMALADARALYPTLRVRQVAPDADIRALKRLSAAAMRYTPWVAIDPLGGKDSAGFSGLLGGLGGDAGLWLDVSGCAHLFGGEDALLADLIGRFEGHGFAARAGVAATPGAAWALARFAETTSYILAPGTEREALGPLPVAALRIGDRAAEALERVGLRRVDDLLKMPRGPLAKRFGRAVLERLDQALGKTGEPISPRRESAIIHARRVFAEPIGRTGDIEAALAGLLGDVAAGLETAGLGARRLDLNLYQVDNSAARVRIGSSRPVRDPGHLARLFRDKMEDFDAGFGVEVMALAAVETARLALRQGELANELASGLAGDKGETVTADATARLVDRLAGRLGPGNVTRLSPQASHVPERASREIPVLTTKKDRAENGETHPETQDLWPNVWQGPPRRGPRPIQLLAQPMPIEVMAPVPDGPPVLFRWRRRQHRVAAAEGPERIAPEWWQRQGCLPPGATTLEHGTRDYYRVEDEGGKRYWLFREGLYRPDRPPRWYLHGFFT
ncbi:MAG: DNA polymerase Y family protein [Rhodospirillales bacterium]|nr:DNA polymerase Y family protein [Rhodospirillales bacterium]